MYTIVVCEIFSYFFFFKQKTAYEMRISDWSSDVCSSDLEGLAEKLAGPVVAELLEQRRADAVRHAAIRHAMHDVGVDHGAAIEIGRASCRERVCQYV